jgi:GAF domain-containing protein
MNSEKNNGSGAKRSTANAVNDLRLQAARKRLAESRNEEDAIEGLREIVANLLGCEEIGLFRVDRISATFRLRWSFGVDLENYDLLQALGNAGLQRVMSGEYHIELPPRDRFSATKARAFVPIRVANQTIAILAILRLLPQKLAFDHSDIELFKFLSEEAAKPLFGLISQSAPASEGPEITA